jgi:basic membrane protein A
MTRLAHLPAAVAAVALLITATACSSSSAPSATSTPHPLASPTALFPPAPRGTAFIVKLVTDMNGVHDRSFNQLTWEGLRDAQRRWHISPLLAQPKNAGQYTAELVSSAQHYSTITVAVGYGMGRDVYTAAQEFPRARFAIVDGRPLDGSGAEVSLPNVANILFKEQESGYLVGVIAGLMEKERVSRAFHNVIGYVGGRSIAAVDRYLAGYVAGARSVDPGIKIVGDYANTFTDPKTGASIADRQIGQGADILFQVAADTGTGYLLAARSHGVYGIGVDASQSYLGSYILTSAIKRVPNAVSALIAVTEAGRFRGGDHLYGLKQHATGFARPSFRVPADIVARAHQIEKEVAAGKIVPPTTMTGG